MLQASEQQPPRRRSRCRYRDKTRHAGPVAASCRERATRRIQLVGSARGAWAARHMLARLAWFPPAATSNRACGSLAHGSPTFFTAGIQRPVRHDLLGRGATMAPPRLISPMRSGD
jgi:hypothetical protein